MVSFGTSCSFSSQSRLSALPVELPSVYQKQDVHSIGEIGVDVMNCMELAQDRDHWRALVNELVNIPISS